MYRFIALALALSLFTAAPVFAAGAAHNNSSSGGKQEKIVNITNVNNAAVIATGKNSESNLGVVSNEGGQQKEVVNITNMKNAVVVSTDGGKANVGSVINK